jgi:hypothetical protein
MKLNFGLLGIALAQSGDYSDERHDYSYDYNLGNSHYSGFGGDQSYSFNNFGGKVFQSNTKHTQATRLSCWNSNALRDMNMDGRFFDHTSDPYHHYNHQYGFENAYYHQGNGGGAQPIGEFGDFGHNLDTNHIIDVTDPQHSVMAVDPQKWGYQVTNPDAKFHYGHHVENDDLETNANRPNSYQIATNAASFDGVIDDWRFSLRHAGCLYESPDFFYSGETFNMLRYLTYSYQEHLEDGDNVTDGPDVTMVHWVHVFNAHIHIGDFDDYCDSGGGTNPSTEQDCLNGDPIHQFAVVMANPTYEGLGYINFVATYHDAFDNGAAATEVGHRFRTHYDEAALYENSGFWHLSTTGQNVQIDGNAKSWHLPCDSADCGTDDWRDASDRPRGLAISSFPHNQLGKDFRFNIRTLHQMGDGYHRARARASGSANTAYSYFFYAISEIEILFPEYVSYVNDCWRQRNNNNCQSDMVHQIIVDQSSVQMTSSSPQNRNGDIANGNYQLHAKLTNSDGRCDTPGIANGGFGFQACASWCHHHGMTVGGHMMWPITPPSTNTNNLCGNTLNIWGIHRTYDELHMRQFGTIQEIWVQLMYAYSVQTDYSNVLGFESPFPNVFFSAPQVHWVEGFCDDSDYGKCTGYTRLQNVPYAGSDVDGDRWETDADGDGADRGDGFWVDDQNV